MSSLESLLFEIDEQLSQHPSMVTRSAKVFFETERDSVLLVTYVQSMDEGVSAVTNAFSKWLRKVSSSPEESTSDSDATLLQAYYRALHEMIFCRLMDNFDTYLMDILSEALHAQPNRLNDSEEKVSFEYILQFKSLDELISNLVERKLSSLGYDGFVNLDRWFKARTGVSIAFDDNVREKVIELIETRNIVVHNRSRVNEKYLRNVHNSSLRAYEIPLIGLEYVVAAVKLFDALVVRLDQQLANEFSLEMQPLARMTGLFGGALKSGKVQE